MGHGASQGQTATEFRQVARCELPDAGQVVVEENCAYVAHMAPPTGSTIVERLGGFEILAWVGA